MLQRLAAGEADIFQQLRHGIEFVERLACGLARSDQRRQHLKRRDRPVARGRIVGQDHVPRLFAPDIEAALAHPFQHIAVADLGALQRDTLVRQEPLQAQVRHDRRDQPAAAQCARSGKIGGDQCHDLIAIDQPAFFIHDD